MNTLAEIEAVVEALPRRELRRLHTRIGRKLAEPTTRKRRQPSLHDLMKDLCGSVNSGIGDLSNKKKHLRLTGYGKS